MNKSVKFLNVGTVMQAKKKDPNNEDEAPRFYLKLQQQKNQKTKEPIGPQLFPITLANGMVLNDGDVLQFFSKKEQFRKLVEDGKMTQDKADELSFLKYDVCIVKEDDGSGSEDMDF